MSEDLELTQALDQCLTAMARGVPLSDCLSRYPEHQNTLQPLLSTAAALWRTSLPRPSTAALDHGRQEMLAALARGMVKPAEPSEPQQLRIRIAPRYTALRATLGAAGRAAISALLALMLVGGVLLLQAAFGVGRVGPVAGQGLVTTVEGNVLHRSAGADDWGTLRAGTAVRTADRIWCRRNGYAEVVFPTEVELALLEEADVAVVRLPTPGLGPVLYQAQGEVRYHMPLAVAPSQGNPAGPEAPGALQVQTPAAVLVLEGGALSLLVTPENVTQVAVETGRALLLVGDSRMAVVAGETLLATPYGTFIGPLPTEAGEVPATEVISDVATPELPEETLVPPGRQSPPLEPERPTETAPPPEVEAPPEVPSPPDEAERPEETGRPEEKGPPPGLEKRPERPGPPSDIGRPEEKGPPPGQERRP